MLVSTGAKKQEKTPPGTEQLRETVLQEVMAALGSALEEKMKYG